MVDPSPESKGAEALHSSEATVSAEAARLLASGQCVLGAGGRWHGYEIEGPAPESNRANLYAATNVSLMEKVLISAEPLAKGTDWRRAAWEQLRTQMPADSRVLGCIEAVEEDGWRFEVTRQPPGVALREWIAVHKADGLTQKLLLKQIVTAVSALHGQGVVHLNIRPETIFIEDRGDSLELVLGGLDSAMLYNHPRLDVGHSDPFYAPPESVEPEGMASGIGLRAWDWWGVGRVMQELVLGRHVMSVLFGGDVVREPTPQLREQAVALLKEIEPPGVRAGAVEAMGLSEPSTKEMLRGLLTSSRDARWSGETLLRWLANEKVTDQYDLARDARFFAWKGRGFTLAEAVAFFRTEENWAAGEENISDPGNAETLAHFLSTAPDHKADWQKLEKLYAQVESAEWSSVPQTARRTITTAVAWLVLGPPPKVLIVHGRSVDANGLTELLNCSQEFYHCALVKALMSAPCLELIKPLDASAAQVLAHLAEVGDEVLRRAEQHRWVDPEDIGGQARVLRLALETDTTMRTRSDRMRAAYATCRDPELASLLADKSPKPWMNILLVVTGEEPHRFGYVTKAEHARLHLAGAEARCQQLRAAVFWRRVERLLQAGGSCSGSWTFFLILWLGLVMLGLLVARDLIITGSLAVGLAVFRLLLAWRVGELAHRLDPAAQPWSWRDGPARCQADLERVWPAGAAATTVALLGQLAEADAAKAALLPETAKPLPVKPPRLIELWVGLAICALWCGFGVVQLVIGYGRLMESSAAAIAASRPAAVKTVAPASDASPAQPDAPPDPLLSIPGITPEMVAKVRRGEYEIVKEGFGDTLHGPITKWDLLPIGDLAPLPVVSRVTATPVQRAFARVSGELLLDPYGHSTVNALVIVRVPVREGVGLMLYNARERRLADADTLLLREEPSNRTWYQLGRKKVVYLGVPEELQDENSLALK